MRTKDTAFFHAHLLSFVGADARGHVGCRGYSKRCVEEGGLRSCLFCPCWPCMSTQAPRFGALYRAPRSRLRSAACRYGGDGLPGSQASPKQGSTPSSKGLVYLPPPSSRLLLLVQHQEIQMVEMVGVEMEMEVEEWEQGSWEA